MPARLDGEMRWVYSGQKRRRSKVFLLLSPASPAHRSNREAKPRGEGIIKSFPLLIEADGTNKRNQYPQKPIDGICR